MSPEVCENKPYTFKSDVWSLGCVLYELCMLKHAFSADNLLGLVYKIVSDKYEPIPKRYPLALNNLIKNMLTKVADLRPSVRDLLADTYVQSFVKEYVRTRGQCATPASAASRVGTAAPGGGPDGATRTSSGSGAGAYPGAEPAAAPSGRRVGGALGRGAPGHRPRPKPRPAKAPGAAGGPPTTETPKEAMARRRREAADKKAEELKAASQQATRSRDVARQMKEAEFQTTQLGGGMAVVANSSAPTWRPGQYGADLEDSSCRADIEEPLEEISEDDSSNEEYEDDFEDDELYTEDDLSELDEDLDGEHRYIRPQVGHLDIIREEQDFTRVMTNYEQDIGRGSYSPHPDEAPIAVVSGTPPTTAGLMDVRTRASRLREELMRKMGPETFQLAFEFLVRARREDVEERKVKRDLEALVGREIYKMYCFDVDQLVFQQTCLGPR